MKNVFQPGSRKEYRYRVRPEDAATFEAGQVHPFYSTFSLGRDAEWACRLFVLEMKEEDEEGIGTMLKIEHLAPALIGEEVIFEAEVKEINGNKIICSFEAKAGGRLIARGETGQKILKREKLEKIIKELAAQ